MEAGGLDAGEQDTSASNLQYVEYLYERYLDDPGSVSVEWRKFFNENFAPDDGPADGPSFKKTSIFNAEGAAPRNGHEEAVALQDRLDQFVRAYRVRGHMIARLDPLERPREHFRELDPDFYGLTEQLMDRQFSSRTISGPARLPLKEIVRRLRSTYCRSIGVQFMHIDDPEVKTWLQERMESSENRLDLEPELQKRILTGLTDAVIFEQFIQKKYVGAKSFSLEGGESLIPLLFLALDKAAEHGLKGVVLGMAHRGRLNVLANIIGKLPREIFMEFEDNPANGVNGQGGFLGDVKYHMGYESIWKAPRDKRMHLSLCFNPSHLEFVNPVALGKTRAVMDRVKDPGHLRGMAILIHGDAAFAGEGIVQETLNLSELEGYSTGGTLHVVVNNQIGFTTDPSSSRSSVYSTDVAKMLQIPIFHVNGEDPEAVAQVVSLAMDFRRKFHRDVVIDMYCYRRRGHNESDEPAFTQPLMYGAIRRRKNVREGYLEHLLKLGDVTRDEADRIAEKSRAYLEEELEAAKHHERLYCSIGEGVWKMYHGGREDVFEKVKTGVPKKRLVELMDKLSTIPETLSPLKKIERLLAGRRKMAKGESPLDWGAAEALAFATLATEGHRVRVSGQDAQRGTFSHRHGVLHDARNGIKYEPFNNLSEDQAPVRLWNSPLSEAGVLGFEYGYSLASPSGLIIWEAQFGDFANAAQVIIDQFIASAEDKWGYFSGLTLLLPHGFEGMGPEHSSARPERFLMLAADDNMQIANITTPAQLFHCLRRQTLSPWRKPLVIMSPKSLLRHPKAVSELEELSRGRFHRILPDPAAEKHAKKVKRILMCSGKVYYDLAAAKEKRGRQDVAILRLEQLYPLPDEVLTRALKPYPQDLPVHWVQEEPENQGAWRYLLANYCCGLPDGRKLKRISRPAAASPAVGSAAAHKREQQAIVDQAFNEDK